MPEQTMSMSRIGILQLKIVFYLGFLSFTHWIKNNIFLNVCFIQGIELGA